MKKILIANRGEIALRIMQAASEMGIETVAIYAEEDKFSMHRFKADEAYRIGQGKEAAEAYLDSEAIIKIAQETEADAIHPGYGFLSENIDFARRVEEAGLIFIGPSLKHLDIFGDKIKARQAVEAAGLRTLPERVDSVSLEGVLNFARGYGYPVGIKAALGSCRMRVARNEAEVRASYARAKSEAQTSAGSSRVYVEKYIENAKHIEVQILGDQHGNVRQLFERDCSIQQRNQKNIEIAPAVGLSQTLRMHINNAALKLAKSVDYVNAGTVKFLVTDNDFYFIEVKPCIQASHTVTEMITGIDLVVSQLKIAMGLSLESMGIPEQSQLKMQGVALQARIRAEKTENNFYPAPGKIEAYYASGGCGVRLDVGNAYVGYELLPYFDTLLVKAVTYAPDFDEAARKMARVLREFCIQGVETNLPFLINIVEHPVFLTGQAKTSFIDQTPELFTSEPTVSPSTKILNYISDITVNGFPELEDKINPFFLMYPQVLLDYKEKQKRYGAITHLDTPTFFYGMYQGEEIEVQLEKGKVLVIHLELIGAANDTGYRTLFFNINGERREIRVEERSVQKQGAESP
ncbi:ATP-binding protein [Lactococcus ileimucosae]|uniref:ATP-binding protein n=1 Tax=Lactococcus ileimucosae TaxID=2941329 RepID=UPI00351457A5